MHLVQLFLPLYDAGGRRFPRALFDAVRAELTGHFGGVTAFSRAPATGLWEDDDGDVQRDEVVLVAVMMTGVRSPSCSQRARSAPGGGS